MELQFLKPPQGARKPKLRVGRGEASGHGKTSGRGGKGQTARTGGKIGRGFEGGQTPIAKRVPKLGFVSPQKSTGKNKFVEVNLQKLETIDDGTVVDLDKFRELGFVVGGKRKAGIKVLGCGKLTKKLTIKAHSFTTSAKAAIEAAGGTAEIIK
ncbi:MAG TPA: 50S ribosomal protein L15 [Oligoflexia bacterium]|nr:50S ribosomal protein L15 [Oligoflexia bacterium]HMP26480.1 50S ribosomal protein L15 [Oligoflexia bacterium]